MAHSVNAPPETVPMASRPTLTVTYSSSDKGGETHHAIILFLERYEAVTDALNLLDKYMANPTPPAGDVVLKYSVLKKRDGEWIWAEFEPANWSLVVQPGSEVGLFQKQILNPPVANNVFWRGPIYMVFGETKNGLTTWTGFDRKGSFRFSINRPANFAEAVEATKKCAEIWSINGAALEAVKEPGKTLTFYIFEDQNTYLDPDSTARYNG
ncbi:hypothetical protein DFH08DRAFT_885002 [Mycena albidolilacea]|uniref:Uncharacterized protein n=1 Tax=Mycena albidolilacea TaxID=1033008 RepID=A0AAD6ZK89_9AGAR|nr:hypothetical protein DFH08DRAFT_885002 [Mycena albidolilacea]